MADEARTVLVTVGDASIMTDKTAASVITQLRDQLAAYDGLAQANGVPLERVRGPANSPPEAGSNRHLRPVNSPPLTAGTEPLGEAEPSLTNNPIWQA